MADVAERVLCANLLGDLREAAFDSILRDFCVECAACGSDVNGQNISALLKEREMVFVQEPEDWQGGISDYGGVDRDVVRLQVLDYVLGLRLAAVFLAVA